MTHISRRSALIGGIAGLTCLAIPGSAVAAVHAPIEPMRLSRRLVRHLSDGNMIEVNRTWQIAFVTQGRGLIVSGEQTNAEVIAPEKLAPIAEIERTRSTDGMFPIFMDSSGIIVAAGEAEDVADVDRAVQVAQRMAVKNGESLNRQQQLRAALVQVQAASNSLLDRLPRDLFFPQGSGFTDRRDIKLPNGSMGQFEVSYSVAAQPLNGLLEHADRQVVTRVAGTEQRSSEHWELSAIQGD